MKKLRGRKVYMAVKVDLEKAYDRVDWKFLNQTLQFAGIPNEDR